MKISEVVICAIPTSFQQLVGCGEPAAAGPPPWYALADPQSGQTPMQADGLWRDD